MLAALAAVFIGALDLTVIATVLPKMISDLNINTADIDRYVWVVNAYLLAYVVAIPVVGRVSDLIGRRTTFQVALAIFAIGSLWCAVADSLPQLIAARAVQGIGGGALLPITMALIGDLVPRGKRLATIGLVGAVDTLGWVIGPIWGAVVVEALPFGDNAWRWIFWLNIPIALVVGVAIHRTLRPTGNRERLLGRFDFVGAVLLGAGMVALNLGLSSGGEIGATGGSGLRALGGTVNPLADYLLPLMLAAAVALVAFVFWERRATLPVVPLRLFKAPGFAAAMGANFLAGSALIVAMVDVSLVVALLVSPERASIVSAAVLAPFTLLMAVLSFVGGNVAQRLGSQQTAAIGLVLVMVGYAALWLGLREADAINMVPGLLVAGAGFGLVIAPIGATALDATDERDHGIAAGLTLVFRLLGMTVGISTLTAIGVRRLQVLTERLEPITQRQDESTADYLLRQTAFIQDEVIPISVQVVRETFMIAGVVAMLAIIPIMLMRTPRTGTA